MILAFNVQNQFLSYHNALNVLIHIYMLLRHYTTKGDVSPNLG
jgi:hypothetical protein